MIPPGAGAKCDPQTIARRLVCAQWTSRRKPIALFRLSKTRPIHSRAKRDGKSKFDQTTYETWKILRNQAKRVRKDPSAREIQSFKSTE
jgi:hypothetical protein